MGKFFMQQNENDALAKIEFKMAKLFIKFSWNCVKCKHQENMQIITVLPVKLKQSK